MKKINRKWRNGSKMKENNGKMKESIEKRRKEANEISMLKNNAMAAYRNEKENGISQQRRSIMAKSWRKKRMKSKMKMSAQR